MKLDGGEGLQDIINPTKGHIHFCAPQQRAACLHNFCFLSQNPEDVFNFCSLSQSLWKRLLLINIPLHSNHHVIPYLLVLCLSFAPSPDVSHMKDLFCDAELKYYQDNTPNNTHTGYPISCDCMASIEAVVLDYAVLFGVVLYDVYLFIPRPNYYKNYFFLIYLGTFTKNTAN